MANDKFQITRNIIYLLITGVLLAQSLSAADHDGTALSLETAVQKAELIVDAEWINTWDPTIPSTASIDSTKEKNDPVYLFKVLRVYKGSLEYTKEFIIWDPALSKTAGVLPQRNIYFLKKIPQSTFSGKQVEFRGYHPYKIIQTHIDTRYDFQTTYEGMQELLDQVLTQAPQSRLSAFQKVLEIARNHFTIDYLVKQWPGTIPVKDRSIMRSLLYRDDIRYNATLTDLIRDKIGTDALSEDELITMIKQKVNIEDNIRALEYLKQNATERVQNILYTWVIQGYHENNSMSLIAIRGQKARLLLNRYARRYVKDKLRKTKQPFWIMIPWAKEISMSDKELRRKEIADGVLSLSDTELKYLTEIAQADRTAPAVSSPILFHAYSRHGLVLLTYILEEPDSPLRRLVIALLRSHAIAVEKENISATDPSCYAAVPVKIRLEIRKNVVKRGRPFVITIKEIFKDDSQGLISRKGEYIWSFSKKDSKDAPLYTDGIIPDLWYATCLEQEDFETIVPGKENAREFDLQAALSSIPALKGMFTMRAIKIYPHDGHDLNINAWTGFVVSNTLEISIE